MNPQVSIIIASYNHAPFVGETIQSVLDQSFQDFEIIVTDDASKDGTPDVVRRFADPRISMEVFLTNRGEAVATNAAIRRSKGEFVCILHSDDYFLPKKLAKQVEFLKANPQVAAVFGMPKRIDERGNPLGGGYSSFTFPFARRNPLRREWLRHFFFYGNCLCHTTVMQRRSVYAQIGLYDPRFGNLPDFEMWMRLCMVGEIHVMVDELTAYRTLDNDRNISAPRRDSRLRDMFEFFQILKHYKKLEPDFAREVFKDDLAAIGIKPDGPYLTWLGELALHGHRAAHHVFALDTMYEGLAGTNGSHRLVELTGSVDAFRILAVEDAIDRITAAAAKKSRIVSMDDAPKISRNDPCPCGSGKKYKHCHGRFA
jgi:glycosyltransferase involved in cell wall biosynthesis